MQFSTTELRAIIAIQGGTTTASSLQKNLKKSQAQCYKLINTLQEKNVITKDPITLQPILHIRLLAQFIKEHPQTIPFLADSGINIATATLKPRSLEQLQQEIGYKAPTLYKKLQQARTYSLIQKEQDKYSINLRVWSQIQPLLESINAYNQAVDDRLPEGSIIIYKTKDDIIYKNEKSLNITKTGFSAFEKYKIPIFSDKKYYAWPPRKLDEKIVFKHAIIITQKDPIIQHYILLAIFYAKYKKLLFSIQHPIVNNIKKILNGEIITGYPSKEEIDERAKIYGVTI